MIPFIFFWFAHSGQGPTGREECWMLDLLVAWQDRDLAGYGWVCMARRACDSAFWGMR